MLEETFYLLHNEGYHEDRKHKIRWQKVEVELLVLAYLNFLGSEVTRDLAEELTNVVQETIRMFYHNALCK